MYLFTFPDLLVAHFNGAMNEVNLGTKGEINTYSSY